MVTKEFHDKGGDAAVDADEDVDAGEDDVGGAGDLKEEGGRVHERGDGPAGDETDTQKAAFRTWILSFRNKILYT